MADAEPDGVFFLKKIPFMEIIIGMVFMEIMEILAFQLWWVWQL
jgi:hypothetical protein